MIPTYTYLRKEKSHFTDRKAIQARGQKNKQKEKKTSFQKTYASPSGQIIKSILAILTYPLFKIHIPPSLF